MAEHWVAREWGSPDAWRLESYDVAAPDAGELTIRVHAAGVNPADAKHVATARAGIQLPVPIGYEVSGVVTAVGPDTEIVTGPVAVGDEVIAFRVRGGYATELTVPAQKVLRKPATLSHPEASNLLLAGTTAAEMLHVSGARSGETVLLHGASGAVGVSVLQQAALQGIRVIGTASPGRFDTVSRFGGVPVAHGDGLEKRLRQALTRIGASGIDAALDAVGTDEAIDVSLAVVRDMNRIVTIAAAARAERHGFHAIAGSRPDSARFRDEARPRLVELAEQGRLEVPMAATYPLADAPAALRLLSQGHPGGKLALLP
ncbi:NADP-dependent oxidoreductase [Microbacterium esteraromaticum]|uniref:NADP-dependent oxidoreductase n=1 Tax=Microbacterium esteraromaticum TaxID=57043 RepID=A0A7D8AKV8_9MICO|nr:NADP-dependent oxidoreductase [Microbacterium esteraromaticum]QMU98345.1 NADP-dependent oxidoreductase [Microbacterium esteraromaticum]